MTVKPASSRTNIRRVPGGSSRDGRAGRRIVRRRCEVALMVQLRVGGARCPPEGQGGVSMSFDRCARRVVQGLVALLLIAGPCRGDSSGPDLASYYDRHMAIVDGAAFGWTGSGQPKRLRDGVTQVGVSNDSYLALTADGVLLRWSGEAREATPLMSGVASFASGRTGVFAIDAGRALWHIGPNGTPRRVAADVVAAAIGDGADYYVTSDGSLHVKGNANRGQYGDGRLLPTADFVRTAGDAVDVKAHTGHAIYLARNGDVMGTGGNIFGPLSTHGLGDKATRWGRIFDAAIGVATGASHTAAIRRDKTLWIWGAGYGPAPRKVLDNVTTVAAGSGDTIARTADGALWQWEAGKTPRRIEPGPR